MTEAGPILLLTRPEAAATRFLADLGTNVTLTTVISPLIGIEDLPVPVTGNPPAALILTSENGVAAAGRMGMGQGTIAYCVGERTAAAAQALGLTAQSADGDAEALIALILSRGGPAPLLHLRGQHARGDIAPRLTAAGLPCTERIVYRQNDLPLSGAALAALQGTRPVVLPLFSPRTVSILARQGPFSAPLHVIAISGAVAEKAQDLAPRASLTVPHPDAAAMVVATLACITSFKPAGPA